jgi:hypothetical protein
MSLQSKEFYIIRIEGQLDAGWADWFDEMAITPAESDDPMHDTFNETILSGFVADQAALHGLLIKLRDLNLPLIAVNRLTHVQRDK